jgi:hypothetical protein
MTSSTSDIIHLISYYLGIFIIFASHLYMLVFPKKPIMSMAAHAYLNIAGCVLIAYYFMAKEGFIKF